MVFSSQVVSHSLKFKCLRLNIISWHINQNIKALFDMISKESCTHIKVKNEHASVLITNIIFNYEQDFTYQEFICSWNMKSSAVLYTLASFSLLCAHSKLHCSVNRLIKFNMLKEATSKINPQLLLLAEHHIYKRADVKEISELIPIKLPRCQRISQNLHFDLNFETQHTRKFHKPAIRVSSWRVS